MNFRKGDHRVQDSNNMANVLYDTHNKHRIAQITVGYVVFYVCTEHPW